MLSNGLIIKISSDTFSVKVESEVLECKSRGKFRNENIKPLVGDKVLVDKNNLTIEKVLDRNNYLLRPKVANIDIALIVTSIKQPDINLSLLDKLISIITIHKIEPVIIFTKLDLINKEELKYIKELIKYYESINIKVFINTELNKIKKYLSKKIVTVCGQTGAGKSTLINHLSPNLNLKTDEISLSLGRGKHTTRTVELFILDDYYIVDTPGFSAIDIDNYTKEDIRNSFNEFKNINCKFNDCTHNKEIGCEVIKLVNDNKILKSRYDNYIKFIKETK